MCGLDYVNMTPDELRDWLETEDSQSAGWSKDNSGKVSLELVEVFTLRGFELRVAGSGARMSSCVRQTDHCLELRQVGEGEESVGHESGRKIVRCELAA